VIVDMAHNEASLLALLEVARGLRLPGGRVPAMLGTARDRSDELIRSLGELVRLLHQGRPRSGSPTCPPTRASWPPSRPWSPNRAPRTCSP
jgi:hypothetical protein